MRRWGGLAGADTDGGSREGAMAAGGVFPAGGVVPGRSRRTRPTAPPAGGRPPPVAMTTGGPRGRPGVKPRLGRQRRPPPGGRASRGRQQVRRRGAGRCRGGNGGSIRAGDPPVPRGAGAAGGAWPTPPQPPHRGPRLNPDPSAAPGRPRRPRPAR